MSGKTSWFETSRTRQQLGVVFGAVAFVVGVAGTYWVGDGMETRLPELFTVTQPDTYGVISSTVGAHYAGVGDWARATWLYHDAHFASVEGSMVVRDQTVPLAFVPPSDVVVQALVVVVLGAAGYLLASRVRTHSSTDAAKAGAHVVLGYLPAAAASVFLFAAESQTTILDGSVDTTLSVEPALASVVTTAALAAVLLGALGGYVASTPDRTGHATAGRQRDAGTGPGPAGSDAGAGVPVDGPNTDAQANDNQ